jgi:signal transduction histidine kinase
MTFRALFATLIVFALLALGAFLFLSVTYVQTEINALFPSELARTAALHSLDMLLVGQAVALGFAAALLAFGIYWVIGNSVSIPLQELIRSMEQYSMNGTRREMPSAENAPKEIRSLVTTFQSFIDRAEEAHKHDQEVSRVKSDFISTAAHQFRTPLTGIRWALEALEKENLTENQRALVKSAVDKSHDLVGIVGTLLDISAIESGKYAYQFAPTDMHALVKQLVVDFSPLAVQKGVSLFYPEDTSVTIPAARADQDRIKWVLNNLIENAIKYTPAQGSVRISVDAAERRVFVRIKDNGIGILPEDRANIFERFYRAQNAISKEQKGNGLGLYIARTIATDHGGDLNFIGNEDGPGTTFVLSLPIA